jgi:hypothetical protein
MNYKYNIQISRDFGAFTDGIGGFRGIFGRKRLIPGPCRAGISLFPGFPLS